MTHITFIGGGSGISAVLSSYSLFKNKNVKLCAIITPFDSGGSTGLLRKEFGIIGVGDIRQVMTTLSGNTDMKKLFSFRFPQDSALSGHSMGNLIFAAFKETGLPSKEALFKMKNLLDVEADIIPSSWDISDLNLLLDNGDILIGEHNADHMGSQHIGRHIKSVGLSKKAYLSDEAKEAIKSSDLIVIGPGDLYTSIIPNMLTVGFKEAIRAFKGQIIYIPNLMNKTGSTDGFSIMQYVNVVEKYLGRKVDKILVNNKKVKSKMLRRYEKAGSTIPFDDTDERAIRADLIDENALVKDQEDKIYRGYVRHSSKKVLNEIFALLPNIL